MKSILQIRCLYLYLYFSIRSGKISKNKINLADRVLNFIPLYHQEKTIPARGDITIIIIENVKDSMEISVALCSEGNVSCSMEFVLT